MDVRPSPIAGQWYPADPQTLRQNVEASLEAASRAGPPAGEVVALLAPHAGHIYSGAVAARAFAAVRGQRYDRVAILCPSHFHADGPLLTSGHAAYATPLGQVEVDQAAVQALRQALAEELGVPEARVLAPIRQDREHAIEIELPFLQCALDGPFRLLPVMLRDQTGRVAHALGLSLARVLRSPASGRALVVASSDLSHFFPQTLAERYDAAILRQVEAFDPDGVLMEMVEPEARACGHGAIAAGLWAAQALGARQARVLHHATSGDVSGDYAAVVGYGAAVFLA